MSKKRRATGVIGNRHRVSREESMKWFQQKVGCCRLSVFPCPPIDNIMRYDDCLKDNREDY